MSKPFGLKSRLNFGKHKGEEVQDVILEHPDYLLWCLDNIEWFELTPEAREELDARSIEKEV